jgi:RNA polymerase sigma-70 factor (ECF subfamily)
LPDDSELLDLVRRGDHAAFRTLLDRHARYLYGVAHAMSGNDADAEDLVQETLVAALSAKFRGQSSVRTWLVGILSNRAAMWRRSRGRREKRVVPRGDALENAPGAATRSSAPGVDAKTDLSTMLESLTPEHRQVIVLRELEGLSYEEMAAALKIPRGTVESRLFRAREELRKKFEGYLT